MEKFFSIGKTAEMVGMTAETLRHYDRIGLVHPCKTDEWTGYRYYSQQEIVRLDTVKTLRSMDMSLSEIKRILSYDDFGKIVDALKQAEKNADEKIAELNYAKTKIRRARLYYESKLGTEKPTEKPLVKFLPRRVVLLSESLETPTLENLRDYHRHFYRQLPEDAKGEFAFEDMAGIYECGGRRRLFTVCTKYRKTDGIMILPLGNWLCAECTEENRDRVTKALIETAKTRYGVVPEFTVQLIVVSGILQWNYQAQVFLSE